MMNTTIHSTVGLRSFKFKRNPCLFKTFFLLVANGSTGVFMDAVLDVFDGSNDSFEMAHSIVPSIFLPCPNCLGVEGRVLYLIADCLEARGDGGILWGWFAKEALISARRVTLDRSFAV